MKPIASLSLDLDNKWAYLKTHGDRGWETFPSYLDVVVPRVLHMLKEHNLTITMFIVGQDAALDKNQQALEAIAAAGHEIGNHSFHHEPWLHRHTEQQISSELARAEEYIEGVTGQKPVGFRGPGFSLSATILRILTQRGYLYDASTFPTFLGPLARAYYFMTTTLSPEEARQRQDLFGNFQDGLRPITCYQWRLEAGPLIEIPVTTMPLFKVPIHLSYLLYLSTLAPALAMRYFKIAMGLCRLTGIQPSLLLHPLDFLNGDDVPELSFFPAMQLASNKKLALVDHVLSMLTDTFTVVTVAEHAQEVRRLPALPVREPRFGASTTGYI